MSSVKTRINWKAQYMALVIEVNTMRELKRQAEDALAVAHQKFNSRSKASAAKPSSTWAERCAASREEAMRTGKCVLVK